MRTDRELLGAHASGDAAAFGELAGRYAPMVLGRCRRLLGDAHEAEDACQAVFVVLARRAAGIRRGESLAAWLLSAAGHVCRTALRSRARRLRLEEEAMAMRTAAAPTPPFPPDPELVAELDRALDALPAAERAAVAMHYLAGRTQAEVARELGCPEQTAHWRIGRGLERLRERLGRRGVSLGAAGLAAALTRSSPPVPGDLLASLARLGALSAAAGAAAAPAGLVSLLAEGAMSAMLWAKLKSWCLTGGLVAAGLVAAAAAALGAGGGFSAPVGAVPAPTAGTPAQAPAAGQDDTEPRTADPAAKPLERLEGVDELKLAFAILALEAPSGRLIIHGGGRREKGADAEARPVAEKALGAAQQKELAALIAQLGHEDWAKREEASARIEKLGRPALAELRPAAGSKDLEVARRAAALVAKLELPAKAEEAIRRGLDRLVAQQAKDGSWSWQKPGGYSVAVTAVAVMALLGDGRTPEKCPALKGGAAFLLGWQGRDGQFCSPAGRSLNEHALTVMALSELLRATGDAKLREPLEKAVKLSAAAQCKDGSWTYQPVQPRAATGDTHNSAFQLVALGVARSAGVAPSEAAVKAALGYLEACQGADGGIAYTRAAAGGRPVISAAAALAIFLNIDPSDERASHVRALAQSVAQPLGKSFEFEHAFWAAAAERLVKAKGASEWCAQVRQAFVANQNADAWWDDLTSKNEARATPDKSADANAKAGPVW